MGIGISVILLAAGAVMRWAVNADGDGFDVDTIGVILLIPGAIGLLWSLAVSSAMPWRREEVVKHHRAHRA